MEEALQRLMPVALSEGVQAELETSFDELGGGGSAGVLNFRMAAKWLGGLGLAAAVALSVFVALPKQGGGADETVGLDDVEPEVVFLEEADRVEQVSDEGLYVDAGGSAVRKLRVRVVEESRMRDEETGIVVDLSSPREETYLVPVSAF
ncbi:MAG: hypothetical protein ABJQ29_16030 [Luteolibacter sp.]